MELIVLNQEFERIQVIDTFESLIWTDRYYAYGDFELYTPMNVELLKYLRIGYYVYLRESEHMMIITHIQTTTDLDDGDHLIVRGRSLESILERRIIKNSWKKTTFSDTSIVSIIEKLVNEAFISTDAERKISNLSIKKFTDKKFLDIKISTEYEHDRIYDVVQKLCEDNKLGFKITCTDDYKFIFELYSGADRSYAQTDNTYVVFSPQFDNIITSEYNDDTTEMCNVAYCVGKDESNRKVIVVGDTKGIDRRELYVDVSDVGNSDSKAKEKLTEKGNEGLKNNKRRNEFDGEVDATSTFVYGVDFQMGDIVQVIDAYGLQGATYVTEMIFSQDDEGIKVYPKFTFADDEDRPVIDESIIDEP